MTYVDGFVLVVPKKRLGDYRKMAQLAGKVWKKHGALQYLECVGDDLKPKFVTFTFPKMVKAKPGEVVIFSWILHKSKAARNRTNAAVMKDPAMDNPKYKDKPMPFDMKRMAYAGFKPLVER